MPYWFYEIKLILEQQKLLCYITIRINTSCYQPTKVNHMHWMEFLFRKILCAPLGVGLPNWYLSVCPHTDIMFKIIKYKCFLLNLKFPWALHGIWVVCVWNSFTRSIRRIIDFRFIAKSLYLNNSKQNNERMEFQNCTVAKTQPQF